MPSSLRTLQLVVVARRTTLRLHAQHLLHIHVSFNSLQAMILAYASKTYVSFLSVRPSSTSCLPSGVPPRRQAARAYRAHRDSTPSRLCFDSIWRRRSVGKERGRWFCRGVVSMSKVGFVREVARRGGAAVPSVCSLAALFCIHSKGRRLHDCTSARLTKHLMTFNRTGNFSSNFTLSRTINEGHHCVHSQHLTMLTNKAGSSKASDFT